MKKFISFVMAAAMVASLVPATAFAKGDVTATAKIVDAINSTKGDMDAGWITEDSDWVEKVPELQLTITNTDYRDTEPGGDPTIDVTLSLDNATFAAKNDVLGNPAEIMKVNPANRVAEFLKLVTIRYDNDRGGLKDKTFTANPAALADDLGDKGAAVVYDSKTGKSVSIPTTLTAAADEAAFLKWVLSNSDLDAKFSLGGVTEAWKDTDGTIADAANRVQIIDDGAFVAPYDVEDFIDDVTAGTNAFAVDGTTTTTAVALNNITIKIGTTKTYAASGWNAVPYTQAEKIADYVAAGYQQGYLKETTVGEASATIGIDVIDFDEDQVTYRFTGKFAEDDMIIFDLCSLMDRTGEGRQATVSVSSKMVSADDLVYAGVSKRGITASTKKVTNIAEEEVIGLDSDIKVSSTVGDFVDNQWFELKLSKGFEFSKLEDSNGNGSSTGVTFWPTHIDGGTAYIQFDSADAIDQDTFVIDKEDIDIETTSAKSGATCTLTIKALNDAAVAADGTKTGRLANAFNATTTVEIMKVVDYKVELSVDEDEDMPVIYSGVDVDNYGITDDSDHLSLEVTAKETFPGAWSMRKGFNFELPEHVYVTDVQVMDTENFYRNGIANAIETEDVRAAFWNAYQDGKHVNFEFDKRVFDDVDNNLREQECAEMTFQLELVADPGFEGDVVLKLTGDLVDEQEVTIAKFVKPYEVKAEQNDLKIDYRYTDIPTTITITEAEAGLWAKNDATFYFSIEKAIAFDSDPTFEIDSKSDLEIKDAKVDGGTVKFTVKSESSDAATVTIKDMDLFMNRSIPAGPYNLEIDSTLAEQYEGQALWAPDVTGAVAQGVNGASVIPAALASRDDHGTFGNNRDDSCSDIHNGVKADSYVGCVCDYSKVVKEAFVNVITAGREVDDASFTTKVVVPVGESYIVAGEKQIELDTPAYINEAGYTMLPIRAVATALGINNNNVLWDQPTKTVTILYGQRIITMTQGQKVVYVNGSAIPASAAVENTNSRTFLPMRDLATALGVTDITWDQATRTATLNGNQNTAVAK